jgi:hypothetical protein
MDNVGELDGRMTPGMALMPSLVNEVPQLGMGEEPSWPDAESLAPAAQAATPNADASRGRNGRPGRRGADWPEEPEVVLAAEADQETDVAASLPARRLPASQTRSAHAIPGTGHAAPRPVLTPSCAARSFHPTPSRGAARTACCASEPPDILASRTPARERFGYDEALPYRSSGAGSNAMLAAVWDASTRALEANAQRAALRPCDSCGLTVSSTARFCRRCGAPQTLSA